MAQLFKGEPSSATSQIQSIIDRYVEDTNNIISSIKNFIDSNSYESSDADAAKELMGNISDIFTKSLSAANSLSSSVASANSIMKNYENQDELGIDPIDDSKIGYYKEEVKKLQDSLVSLYSQLYDEAVDDKGNKYTYEKPGVRERINFTSDEIKKFTRYIEYLELLAPTDVIAAGQLESVCTEIDGINVASI